MENTTKLSHSPENGGNTIQHLEPVAAVPSTEIGHNSSVTEACLSLICEGLLAQTYSGDAFALAMLGAKDRALQAGIPETEFNRVAAIVLVNWRKQMARNPISRMF